MILPVLTVYPLYVPILKRPFFACLVELDHSQWFFRQGVDQKKEQKRAKLIRTAYLRCSWCPVWFTSTGIGPVIWISFSNTGVLARL